ncbi:hypothetical protein MMPV_008315 [Pyropia vietnamensis]
MGRPSPPPPPPSPPSTPPLPRDAHTLAALVAAAGAPATDSRVLPQLFELLHRSATSTLDDARDVAAHDGRAVVGADDVRLAAAEAAAATSGGGGGGLAGGGRPGLTRAGLVELAREVNARELEPVGVVPGGLRLPPLEWSLMGRNYQYGGAGGEGEGAGAAAGGAAGGGGGGGGAPQAAAP